jgi:hypothetical protein
MRFPAILPKRDTWITNQYVLRTLNKDKKTAIVTRKEMSFCASASK